MWMFWVGLALADTPVKGATPIGGTVKAPPNVEIIPAVLEGSVKLVLADRDGDEVIIDGWPAGNLPLTTQLAEGPHEVRVNGAKGKLDVTIWVTIQPNAVPEINLAAPPPPPPGIGAPIEAAVPVGAPPAPKNPS